jgi:uncharacterized protein
MREDGIDLVKLDRDECLELLGHGEIGRVGFTERALPMIQPVNYVLDDEEIVFRTANGSKLAAAVARAVVAFQVDGLDHATRTGWTVTGIGEAYEVVDPRRLAELAALHPRPWVRNRDAHTIAVPLQVIIGRRLVATESAAASRG